MFGPSPHLAVGPVLLLMFSLMLPCFCNYHEYSPSDSMCESISYRDLPIGVQNEHQCLMLEQLHTNVQLNAARRDNLLTDVITRLSKLETRLSRGMGRLSSKLREKAAGSPALKDIPVAGDCNQLREEGVEASGVYPIILPNGDLVNVYCDMLTEGGGWTIIQQREGGVVNFTRKWNDYAFGFGNVNTEFWLGNENIHSLTKTTRYSLRVDLWDWANEHAFAQYLDFSVAPEAEGYRLTVEEYDENSTAGDSLIHHNGMKFTTIDRDNDQWWANCARRDQSGWWFNQCSYCSLNGIYHKGGKQRTLSPDSASTGITWYEWKKQPGYSMMRVQMKLKPRIAVLAYNKRVNKTEAVFH